MSQQRGVRTVKTEVTMPLGTVRLVRSHWPEETDFGGTPDQHHLQLSVMPQVRGAVGGFPARWGPHRYVRLGETFLFPAGQEIHVKALSHVQQSICCILDPEAGARFWDTDMAWTDSRLEACLNVTSPPVRNLLFRIGQELSAPRFGTDPLIELLVGQVLIELSRHLVDVERRDGSGGLAPWRVRLIDERLQRDDTPPTLEELAALCNLSVRHMTRAFRTRHGHSIGSYIAEHRIERAKLLLLSGTPVKAVADQMKFATPSNFTTAFRRLTGETPREFLQRKPGSAQAKAEPGFGTH